MSMLRDEGRSLLHWDEGRRSKAWEVWCENDPKNGHATEDMRDSIINPQRRLGELHSLDGKGD